MPNPTSIERTSDREMRVTRLFDAPPHLVFRAWTTPELFKRWWAPKSMGMVIASVEMDVRSGGGYRLEFDIGEGKTAAFFGSYLEVTPPTKLVWTNDEGGEVQVTTVSFEERDGKTLLTYHELYPSKAALDEAYEGMGSTMGEQLDQLDALLAQGLPAAGA